MCWVWMEKKAWVHSEWNEFGQLAPVIINKYVSLLLSLRKSGKIQEVWEKSWEMKIYVISIG